MDARCPKVTWNEDTVSGRPHCRQEARSLHIHSHDVWDGLLTQTLDDVLVVLHHVGGHGAVEAVGYLDCVVDGVLHQGPGWERGARHQDRAVKQSWDEVDRWWGEQYNAVDENYYRALNFNVFGTKFQLLQLSSKSDWCSPNPDTSKFYDSSRTKFTWNVRFCSLLRGNETKCFDFECPIEPKLLDFSSALCSALTPQPQARHHSNGFQTVSIFANCLPSV